MKKRAVILVCFVFVFLISFVNSLPSCKDYFDGLGTSINPFNIADCTGLQNINVLPPCCVNKVYQVVNDFSCSGTFTKLCASGFSGNFSGNNHTISNLTISCTADYCGLFAQGRSPTPIFRDVGLVNIDITSSNSYVGGLIGRNSGNIFNSHAIGNISGNTNIGGLVGYDGGEISNSYFKGNVIGSGDNVGGLVGRDSGNVFNSYVIGNITGSGEVGGLVGYGAGDINGSFFVGKSSGTFYIGGLVGELATGIHNSYVITYGIDSSWYSIGGLAGSKSNGVYDSYVYSQGITSGGYSGGLVGDAAGGIYNSFFIGNTSVGGNFRYSLVGQTPGTVQNSFWSNSSGNPATCGASSGCTAIDNNVSYFKNSNNLPIVNWSTNIWRVSSNINDGLPYLIGVGEFNPSASTFTGDTTDFTNVVDLINIVNATLQKSNTKIKWINNINVNAADFDNNVIIESGFISVDIANLDSSLNSTVEVTVEVDHCDNVEMYHSPVHVTNQIDWDINKEICNSGTSPACNLISCSGGLLTFQIDHLDGAGAYGFDPVPEFSSTTLLLAVLITIFGLIAIRKKVK